MLELELNSNSLTSSVPASLGTIYFISIILVYKFIVIYLTNREPYTDVGVIARLEFTHRQPP